MEYANFAQLDHSLMLIKIDAYAQEITDGLVHHLHACHARLMLPHLLIKLHANATVDLLIIIIMGTAFLHALLTNNGQ